MTASYTVDSTATTTLPIDPVVPVTPITAITAIVVDWEESEAGWGTRPDGWTLHSDRAAHRAFLAAMRDREAAIHGGTVPAEYSRPVGRPRPVTVTAEVADLIADRERDIGTALWGAGRYGPDARTLVDLTTVRKGPPRPPRRI